MKRIAILALVFLTGMLGSCKKDSKSQTVAEKTQSAIVTHPKTNGVQAQPSISGKLVYHSYSCYACTGTKMYIYNFNTNTLTWVSQNWNIDYPMNAHFSPDGTKIVFMGQPAGSGDWDIYLWTIGSSSAPTNLTAGNGLKDEDPKFSPNGYRIAFKQDG